MCQVNGTGTHFWLKEGELTPLLDSGGVTLSGKTFNRPDTGHQWFDQFVVSNQGKAVLDVANVKGNKMQVKLNGKVVSSGKVRGHPSPCSTVPYLDAPFLLTARLCASQLNADGMAIEFDKGGIKAKAGSLAVTIYSSQATKFASGTDKTKYEHLNINFESGIPTNAKGIFAELAGVQEMSEATTALLKQPKGVAFYQAAAKQCPAGCVPAPAAPAAPPPPTTIPISNIVPISSTQCTVDDQGVLKVQGGGCSLDQTVTWVDGLQVTIQFETRGCLEDACTTSFPNMAPGSKGSITNGVSPHWYFEPFRTSLESTARITPDM